MSGAQLGIGVRVYIAYERRELVHGDEARKAICNTGTVHSGPFPPGAEWSMGGRDYVTRERSWLVTVDGVGECVVVERLLTPIDGGDSRATEAAKEREHA